MCNFCVDHVDSVDYKAVNRLRRYVTDRARIDSSKKTGTCAKHQRMVRRAIVKARFMALLPYSPDHVRVTNMLAPRTPAEAVAAESDETTAAASVTDETPQGESVELAEAAAATGEAVPAPEQSTTPARDSTQVDGVSAAAEVEQAKAPEDAPPAESAAEVSPQVDGVSAAVEVEQAKAPENAAAAESTVDVSPQAEASSASMASAAGVVQPEDKSETDNTEVAKV